MKIEDLFDSFQEEYLKFERIKDPPSKRPDLCAFILLDKLFPPDKNTDIIAGAAHDEIYLDVDSEQVEKLTEEQIIYLLRCGVNYDSDTDGLSMYA